MYATKLPNISFIAIYGFVICQYEDTATLIRVKSRFYEDFMGHKKGFLYYYGRPKDKIYFWNTKICRASLKINFFKAFQQLLAALQLRFSRFDLVHTFRGLNENASHRFRVTKKKDIRN